MLKYYNKYHKYKLKYIEYKKQYGGECFDDKGNIKLENEIDPITNENLGKLNPYERLSINNVCYETNNLYQWIKENNTLPNSDKLLTPEEREKLVYNMILYKMVNYYEKYIKYKLKYHSVKGSL